MTDEEIRQSWGEQRARNSGWNAEQYDVSNPDDYRFKSYGISGARGGIGKLVRVVSALNTPCVVPEKLLSRMGDTRWSLPQKNVVETTPVRFPISQEFWNFKEFYLDRRHGMNGESSPSLTRKRKTRKVNVQLAKFTALQFGLRMDHRWFLDEHIMNAIITRATPIESASFYLSRNCTTDHVCRNNLCLNPGHRQLVPSSENIFRISVPDLNATIPCIREDCNFAVPCTWPMGFNLCQACGGDAPYIFLVHEPRQMELFE